MRSPKLITFTPAAIAAIRAGTKTTTRRRIHAPRWWEGNRIAYKVYPFGPGTIGRYAEVICDRGGGHQRRNPYGEPGELLRPRGTDLTIEIESVELAGDHSVLSLAKASRREACAWIVEFRRVDTAARPASMTKAYADLPAKACAKMVEYAQRQRARHFEALQLQPGDTIAPVRSDRRRSIFTLLKPLDGSMMYGRWDHGGGDLRTGFYDVDRHVGRLYAGPDWKRVRPRAGHASRAAA